jgi:VIT1/CCC1 family predicted Fe2+/Mn2+ transporter
MEEKYVYLKKLYEGELLHRNVYRKFMEHERNPTLRDILGRLSKLESRHAELWGKLVKGNVRRHPGRESLLVMAYKCIRPLLGLPMTIKIIEYRESQIYRKLDKAEAKHEYTSKERSLIQGIRKIEEKRENPLVNKITEYSPILNNIRDVTFGMNDGLVEILAVTVGLGAALQQPFLVIIAGLIVAISGTLSMAGGAYLATIYEKEVRILQKRSFSKPARSALYVGFSYLVGAMFPLLPFMAGYSGVPAIALSLAITAVTLSVVASTIAIITNVSIKRRVVSTLAITFGIAAVTILLGYFARVKLELTV